MPYPPVDSALFVGNRERLRQLIAPGSLAVVNANDVLPTNADGTLRLHPNSDLFYLTGIEQEESILLLAPDAYDEALREVLFIRESSPVTKLYEGSKLSQEETRKVSGVKTIRWLGEFRKVFHRLMCTSEDLYLNHNEHPSATLEVQTRDVRFIRQVREEYPLHRLRRLAPLLRRLRMVKSPRELDLLKTAITITAQGHERARRFLRPKVNEREVEAEFAHEFIRRGARFAFTPIIASGQNSCVLHYTRNDQPCRRGDVLLLDVGATYANYNSDVTRTLPVSGRFTRRQKDVYQAVLRVLRASIAAAVVGAVHRDWQRQAQTLMNEELLALGLLKKSDIKRQTLERPACRKKHMPHGICHHLGIDTHDVGGLEEPLVPGWVLAVEPAIYIPDEGFGVRLEDDILITDEGPVNLTEAIAIEPEEVEAQVGN